MGLQGGSGGLWSGWLAFLFQKDTGFPLSLLLHYIRAGAWARCGSSTEQCSPLICFGSQEERRFAISAYGMKIAGDGT